jgi:uncharacterized phiE125 gp8 family phage protein
MLSEAKVDIKGNRVFKVITDPTVEPVTVEEVKIFARIDGTDEDELLEGFIKTIRKQVELYLGKSIITQTIRLSMDSWNTNIIELPMSPLISVTSVETVDEDDTATTYSSDNYMTDTDSLPGRLIIKKSAALPENSEREVGGYRITYIAGYGAAASSVPHEIKDGIMTGVTKLYETRDFTTPLPPKARFIMDIFRTDQGIKY